MKKEEISYNRKTERQEERDGSVMNRLEETRETERRNNAKRVIMNMQYSDPHYFPIELVPPGVEYKWVRHSLYDVPDNNNVFNVEKRGWSPVPASRHPEFMPKDYLGVRTHKNDYIIAAGSILSERAKDLCDLEVETFEKRHHAVMTSMPALENNMGEQAAMPVRNSMETYVTRNKSVAFAGNNS